MTVNDNALYTAAVHIAKPENIMGFLDLIAKNLNMSCLNLIFLTQQLPNADAVCGEKAWQAIGRAVNPDPKYAILFCPDIKCDADKITADYKPVTVVDYMSTTGGKPVAHYKPDNMIGAICDAANCSMEFAPSKAILDSRMRGIGAEYNEVNPVFYLDEKLKNNGSRREDAMLEAYIKYVCSVEGVYGEDNELYNAIRYVVYHYFGMKGIDCNRIRAGTFCLLPRRQPEEILEFLCKVRAFSFDIIESLTAPMLSFEETAVVNALLNTDDKDTFLKQLSDIETAIEYHEWVEIVKSLHEKIEKCIDTTTAELLKKKQADGCIYTLPPYRLSVKEPIKFPEIPDDD